MRVRVGRVDRDDSNLPNRAVNILFLREMPPQGCEKIENLNDGITVSGTLGRCDDATPIALANIYNLPSIFHVFTFYELLSNKVYSTLTGANQENAKIHF